MKGSKLKITNKEGSFLSSNFSQVGLTITDKQEYTIWILENHGVKISLKSIHNTYLHCNNNNTVDLTPNCGESELWSIKKQEGEMYSIQSCTGSYLEIGPYYTVKLNTQFNPSCLWFFKGDDFGLPTPQSHQSHQSPPNYNPSWDVGENEIQQKIESKPPNPYLIPPNQNHSSHSPSHQHNQHSAHSHQQHGHDHKHIHDHSHHHSGHSNSPFHQQQHGHDQQQDSHDHKHSHDHSHHHSNHSNSQQNQSNQPSQKENHSEDEGISTRQTTKKKRNLTKLFFL